MKEILIKTFSEYGYRFDDIAMNKFTGYRNLLVEWNQKFNLTAITDDEGIALKHFVDSLSILPLTAGHDSLADVGTGAGFPGIPLKIAGFKGNVVLMDSLKKRIGFLNTVIDELELKSCSAVHIRAEDAGRGDFREKFSAVTARAVAGLPVLCEYCIPLVKEGGIFIAMKGPEGEQELRDSKTAIKKLGGRVKDLKKIHLADFERHIIVIEKVKGTPDIYPRKAGTPKKKPL